MQAILQNVAWLALPLAKAAVVVLMLRRRLHRAYPLFFSFLAYSGLTSVLLFAVGHLASYRTYFYSYWTTEAVGTLIALGVIYELFTNMFRLHRGLQDFGSILFRWAGVISVLMAFIVIAGTAGADPHRVINFVLAMERAVGVTECGLLLLILLMSTHLGITYKHLTFGIAFGLGLDAAVQLLLITQRSHAVFGDHALNVFRMVTYYFVLGVWAAYAAMPQAAATEPNMLLRPQRWNDALLHASNPVHEQTVLLGIEDLVDRALNKTNGIHKPN